MAAYASSDSLSMHWGKPKIWRASAHAAASRSQSKEAYKQEASIIISPTIMMHPTRARSAATAFRSVPCWRLEREHHFLFIVHAQSLSARSNTPARIASSWSMFFASALMPAMRRSAGTPIFGIGLPPSPHRTATGAPGCPFKTGCIPHLADPSPSKRY